MYVDIRAGFVFVLCANSCRYMMKSSNSFLNPNVDLNRVLESYFMYCAIECTGTPLLVFLFLA